ncbi:hemerythrin domain-containing protein [Metallumcola ferriviriculae]|uniref:Hemerythrin domain-containing protein n=1 Tax=Metallumcola ferriviriculae TaxID=3039180 RepID=A0AAU0ULT6_9FIRM|nr:hemerythrin domain-containing protein [Desulfitibacteraceae bacterium MK1]
MNITDQLKGEHEIILRFLGILKEACNRVQRGAFDDITFFERCITFLREYADSYHYDKEERVLFPAMEQAGIAYQQHRHIEHKYVYQLMADLDRAVTANNLSAIPAPALEYTNLLEEHIITENKALYPEVERVLDDHQKEEIQKEFDRIEGVITNEKDHNYIIAEVDQLENYLP